MLDFLDADYTFVNERLARHYGIADVKGDEFRQVSTRPARRGGVLAGQRADGHVEPHPHFAGQARQMDHGEMLGTPPPPPPPDVPALEEDGKACSPARSASGWSSTARTRSARVCHKAMDPLGFGLENYDAIGAWRDKDGEFDIDPSGKLPGGQTFAGPRELKGVLRARQDEFLAAWPKRC